MDIAGRIHKLCGTHLASGQHFGNSYLRPIVNKDNYLLLMFPLTMFLYKHRCLVNRKPCLHLHRICVTDLMIINSKVTNKKVA